MSETNKMHAEISFTSLVKAFVFFPLFFACLGVAFWFGLALADMTWGTKSSCESSSAHAMTMAPHE